MAFVPAWKRFETWVGDMIGGKRYWANAGEKVDCESDRFTAQCKLVRVASLGMLTQLAIEARDQGMAVPAARGGPKIGLVAVKLSGKRGNVRSPAVFILHEDAFRDLQRTLKYIDEAEAEDPPLP